MMRQSIYPSSWTKLKTLVLPESLIACNHSARFVNLMKLKNDCDVLSTSDLWIAFKNLWYSRWRLCTFLGATFVDFFGSGGTYTWGNSTSINFLHS